MSVPPPYPPPNNPQVCKVSLIFTKDTRTFVNTFHVLQVSGWNLAKMSTVANDFLNWYNTWYKQCLNPAVALSAIQVRLYNPTAPLALDLPVTPPVAGTRGTGTMEAGSTTLTTSWRTGLAGRAYRGRIYVPGIAEPDVSTTDTVVSALTTVLAQAASHLIFGAFTDIVNLVIFHRPLRVPKALDNTATNVITAILDNVLDSQRRRLPGRGK